MKEPLHALTIADEAFRFALAVLVRSTLDHLDPDLPLRLTVIDGGLAAASRQRLLSSWTDPRLSIEWRTPELLGGRALPVVGRIPVLTYARLFAPSLLPPDCERAIVLDADQLVLADLGRLALEPFATAHVLAPRDPFIPFVSSPNGLSVFAKLGFEPADAYFTGALMVVNLAAWRRDRVTEQALAHVARHADTLRSHDQEALNAVLRGSWRELDARWQVQPRALTLRPSVTPHLDSAARKRLAEDPWVVHFSGRLKPWLYQGASRFDALFHEALSRTAFADHRPRRDLRAHLLRLYDGRVRRWVYPLERRLDAALREVRRRQLPYSAR